MAFLIQGPVRRELQAKWEGVFNCECGSRIRLNEDDLRRDPENDGTSRVEVFRVTYKCPYCKKWKVLGRAVGGYRSCGPDLELRSIPFPCFGRIKTRKR